MQADAFTFGGIAGGGADALTLTLSPALGAYSNGLNIRFLSGAAANTGAATIAVNGLAATAVQLAGAALTGGEIQPNRIYEVVYYNTVFHLFQPTAQAPLTLSSTAAGTLLTLTSTDAGAGGGPDVTLYRNSASPANADLLGAVNFDGEDSGGGRDTYARIVANISDVTAASEDANLFLQTMQNGALTTVLTARAGAYIGAPTGFDKGVGTLNSTGLYVNGHGTVAQRITTTSVANTTLGTILPYDDTIPQNTEGDQVFSQAITPTNASSILYIDVFVNVGGPSGAAMSCALFVDATAASVAASSVTMPNSTSMMPLTLRYSVSAASVSARTYTLRCGNSTATDGFLNGHASSRIFGGVAVSSMTVTEVLPQ